MKSLKFIILFLVICLVYFFGWLLLPLEPVFQVGLEGILMLVLGIIAVPLGFLSSFAFKSYFNRSAMVSHSAPFHYGINSAILDRLSNRVNIIGLIGCVCILLDRLYVRDLSLLAGFLESRELMEDTVTSSFGLIGNFLSGMAVFSLGLMFLSKAISHNVTFRRKLLCYLISLLFIITQLMVGSRSGILVVVLVSIFFMLWSKYIKNVPIITSNLMYLLLIGFVFIILMGQIFLMRIDEMGLTPIDSILYSGYGYAVQPSNSFLQFVDQLGPIKNLWLSLTTTFMYVYHGMYEFFILVNDFNGDYAYGRVSFWFPIKILAYIGVDLGGFDIEGLDGVRVGVFTTFLGPLYIDFGVFMPIVVFVLFFLLGLIAMNVRTTNLVWLPFGAILAATLTMFPIMNLMLTASGIYPLVASFFIPLLTKKLVLPSRRLSRIG